jgi:hypothetical protein
VAITPSSGLPAFYQIYQGQYSVARANSIVEMTGTDRAIHRQIVRGSESVSGELPGDLAAAAGRLMRRLASEGLSLTQSER